VGCDTSDDRDYYPSPVCQLDDSTDPTHFGFDVKSRKPIDPTKARDYMAYGYPRWVSDYRFRDMYSEVGAPSSAAGVATTGAPDLSAEAASVYISGAVTETTDEGLLNYAWVLPTEAQSSGVLDKWERLSAAAYTRAAAESAGQGEAAATHHLRLYDGTETLLDDRVVALNEDVDALAEGQGQAFALSFPAPDGDVARIDLLADEAVLASLTPGPAAPVVTILSPEAGRAYSDTMEIAWEATDADPEDHLLHTVQYSPDLGQTWRVLVTGFPGAQGSELVTLTLTSLNGLPASVDGGLIRVAASDGYHTGLAVSDAFEIPDRPPEPTITSPLEGESVPAGEPVTLVGGAYDADDGPVDAEWLSWAVEGIDAGTGDDQLVQGLAPGGHTVQLTATDSVSNAAATSVHFTVDNLLVPDGPEPTLDGYCDDNAYDGAVELQLAPADESQVTVHLLRAGTDLYGCFSGVPYSSGEEDAHVGLLLDGNGSGDDVAQINDYGFFVHSNGSTTTQVGNGAGGFDPADFIGLDGVVSTAGGAWAAELHLDLSTLVVTTGTVGLDVAHFEAADWEVSSHWPYAAEAGSPATWAQAELGSVAPKVMLPIVLKGYSEDVGYPQARVPAWAPNWMDLPPILKRDL
ncbi:MAG: hypothetical protein PVH41_08255, partial [Anaerolineae bacterium]